jgi:SAM-dependent methyltransferase
MASEPAISCVVCGTEGAEIIPLQPQDFEYRVQTKRNFSVRACRNCGTQFVHPRPTPDELISFYPLDYHAYNEDHGRVAGPLVELRAKMRAKAFKRLFPDKTIRLFDVGSGDCRHFVHMEKYGDFSFAGVEIKPEMVEESRRKGYDVEFGTLEDLDIEPYRQAFDLVTMYQLLEHVLDPRQVLEKAQAMLSPGGYVIGQLPCLDSIDYRVFGPYWAGYHFPRHLQMFTPAGLKELLAKAGFSHISVSSAAHLQAGLSLQNYLMGRFRYQPVMKFGKTPIYSLLLLAVAPFCLFEYVLGKGGMMNFMAKK